MALSPVPTTPSVSPELGSFSPITESFKVWLPEVRSQRCHDLNVVEPWRSVRLTCEVAVVFNVTTRTFFAGWTTADDWIASGANAVTCCWTAKSDRWTV